MSGDASKYIAALDVGTTTIRCQIIDILAKSVGSAFTNVKLHYPGPDSVEIDPEELWQDIKEVIKNALSNSAINPNDIKSLGISTQRGTFITWRKDNGTPFHNFITWKDLRAAKLVNSVNNSYKASGLRFLSYMIYLTTGNKKFAIASRLKFASNHVTIRLLSVLQNFEPVKKALAEGNLMFGTLDTWLIYKLTGGKVCVTDATNASATGLYDPFELDWGFLAKFVGIPKEIFPRIVDNDADFGTTTEDIFGVSVRIGCSMADQSAAMFGSCCFHDNDLKVTLGTGAFLDVNTSKRIHPSLNGMYPLVGWKTKEELVYLAEVPCSDAGSLIQWMLEVGLTDGPEKTFAIATSVEDNGGVYFIPAFSGLGPPINDEHATTGFLGVKPTTKKAHLVRAILEGIVFRVALAYIMLEKERARDYQVIRVDGGVGRNDFICQKLADTLALKVERLSSEMGILGVGFSAGIACGIWKNKEDIAKLRKDGTIFVPSEEKKHREKCQIELEQWRKAAERFTAWYSES